jgi:predicted nucleic acid-binding protein
MLLVVDTNIIISSIIKDSTTREILLSADIKYITPEWVLTEIKKLSDYIAKTAGITKDELTQFMDEIFEVVIAIPLDEYKSCMKEGLKIMGKVDKDDAPFIALALALKTDGIWSNDKDFEKQGKVRILKTEDLVKMLNK